jgi:hypothetical protein
MPQTRLPVPANIAPLEATAVDGEVVLISRGRGVPVNAAFTPEAVLASLEPMRMAAEHAVQQRNELRSPDDGEGDGI